MNNILHYADTPLSQHTACGLPKKGEWIGDVHRCNEADRITCPKCIARVKIQLEKEKTYWSYK